MAGSSGGAYAPHFIFENMKKPIFIAVTDIHLEQNNLEQRKGLFIQVKAIMEQLAVKKLMILGDVFESRKAIPENVLNCFGEIITDLHDAGIETFAIPGNHDKLIYLKRESYLTPFEHYPSFTLFQDNGVVQIGGFSIFMFPFYDQEIWIEKFINYFETNKNPVLKEKSIMLSHLAVTGSKNNNGELVENGISRDIFEKFGKTFLGHYHNTHEVNKNIIHIPSICQKNFGEDPNKGVTVVYDDLSYSIINLDFKKYVNIEFDLASITKRQIDKIISTHLALDNPPYIKAKFYGTESEVKSVDKDQLNRLGVSVKMHIKEIDDSIEYSQHEEIKEYDLQSLTEAFGEFCQVEGLNFKEGVKYLK